MPERTVALTPTEAMLIRLAADRKQQQDRVASIELEAALTPVMQAHGKQPTERADIRDGAEPGSFVIVFSSPDIS